jgi:predicted lactoylglutathione lyase
MKAIEIKAFVPARDFALSRQFYQDLGFTVAWSSDSRSMFLNSSRQRLAFSPNNCRFVICTQ